MTSPSIVSAAVVLACALALSGCGSTEGQVALPKTGIALYTSAAGTVTLAVGASVTHTVGGGGGGRATTAYSATSNNPAIATVSVSGDKLTVKAVAAGSASIAVLDSSGSGQTVIVQVTVEAPVTPTPPVTPVPPVTPPVTPVPPVIPPVPVAFYSTAQANLTINAGANPVYLISGGTGPYAATTNNASVATVNVTDNKLTITGVASGSATIAAFDAAGTALQFAVTVPGPASGTGLYSTAQSAINIAGGATPSYLVAGGTAPYTTTSSNAAVATAAVKGNVLTINGLAGGVATIAIFDAAGAVIRTTVTIDSAPAVALFTTAPNPLAIGAGAVSYTYRLAGGKGPYAVNSSAPSIATADVADNTLRITGISNGSANIVVFDAVGASSTIAVAVGAGAVAGTPLYTTAQNAIKVAEGSSTTFVAGGGTGPYVVTSDDTAIATATVAGNALTIKAVGRGRANIRLSDAALASSLISVDVGSATMLYTTSPSSVTIAAGAAPSYKIRGGIGPYVATSSAAGFATVALSGDAMTITGVAAGSANVIVLDAAGNLVTIAVTVPQLPKD